MRSWIKVSEEGMPGGAAGAESTGMYQPGLGTLSILPQML